MSPDEGQEEYEEAQAEIKKKEDEVGPECVGFMMHVKRPTKPGERKHCFMPLCYTTALAQFWWVFFFCVCVCVCVCFAHALFMTHFLCGRTMLVVIQCLV